MNTRKFSSRQEKSIARKFGGKQVSNSGATSFDKGDVSLENFLIEAKTCVNEKNSFTIKKDWLEKINKERFSKRKRFYALAFQFGPKQENYFILDERTFKIFVDLLGEQNEE